MSTAEARPVFKPDPEAVVSLFSRWAQRVEDIVEPEVEAEVPDMAVGDGEVTKSMPMPH